VGLSSITSPLTDSGDPQKVVDIQRIQWSACSGFGGRHGPDSLVDMRADSLVDMNRITQTATSAKYLVTAVENKDGSYYNKSMDEFKIIITIGDNAYSDFKEIMRQYSIPCQDFDYCQ